MVSRGQYRENLGRMVNKSVPYLWDAWGDNGADCSGVVSNCLGLTEKKSAQGLYNMFKDKEILREDATPGCLYFYGESRKKITHVMSVFNRWDNGAIIIAGARGGNSDTISLDVARSQKAFVDTCWGDYWLGKFVCAVDPWRP